MYIMIVSKVGYLRQSSQLSGLDTVRVMISKSISGATPELVSIFIDFHLYSLLFSYSVWLTEDRVTPVFCVGGIA